MPKQKATRTETTRSLRFTLYFLLEFFALYLGIGQKLWLILKAKFREREISQGSRQGIKTICENLSGHYQSQMRLSKASRNKLVDAPPLSPKLTQDIDKKPCFDPNVINHNIYVETGQH